MNNSDNIPLKTKIDNPFNNKKKLNNQKINYRNLIICGIFTGIFSIIIGLIFRNFLTYLQPFQTILGIILSSFLGGFGIIALFPVYEKENKKKKKKESSFDRAIRNMR